jgi:hypothetical protein
LTKRRRLTTAANLEYLADEGRIHNALKAVKKSVNEVVQTLEGEPEIGGEEYDLLG